MRDEEQEFRSLLAEAKQRAVENGGRITQEEIRHIFSALDLSGGQLGLIKEYMDRALEQADVSGEQAGESGKDTGGGHLSLYLAELERVKKLSDHETGELFRKAIQGDGEASSKLVEAFLPRVPEIARLYAGQGVTEEELIGEGNMGLVSAAQMLEVSETEAEAQGFLVGMIMDAMEAAVNRQTGEGRLSGRLVSQVNAIAAKAAELSGDLMRKVTFQELARETEFSREEIRDVLRASGAHIEEIEEEQEDRDE